MPTINYEKILNQLVKEYPHELDKIEKVVNDSKENSKLIYIEYSDIIKSTIWSSEEKVRLLRLFNYNKYDHDVEYIDEYRNRATMSSFAYTFENDNLSSFEALMKIYKDIDSHFRGIEVIPSDNTYRGLFRSIIYSCKEESKSNYIKAILDTLTDDEIQDLLQTRYVGNEVGSIHNNSVFINLIASKDIDLIKKYINYIKDINIYLNDAVATGDIEIVKFFLQKGADINYLSEEVILTTLTPLKTAIVKNDYQMVKFLIDNGADINMQINGDNFLDQLRNYKIDIMPQTNYNIVDKKEDYAKEKYIRTSSPLEYATNLTKETNKVYNGYYDYYIHFQGSNSTISNTLITQIFTPSEEANNRVAIADLLYEKLEDKTNVNYNNLIVITFLTSDIEKLAKYSNDAIKNNYQIDFEYIFYFYFNFHLNHREKMTKPLLDLIKNYDQDGNLYLDFFNYYLKKDVTWCPMPRYYIDEFSKEVLNKIPVEKRKNICLVPYCRDLESLEYLISIGFDINQVDENGNNILYYLTWIGDREFNGSSQELFDYLLENMNISSRNNDNKTALYYALQRFDTKDEYQYARKDKVGTRTALEKAVVTLISKMPKEDVCNEDILTVLEGRLDYGEDFGDKIHLEYIYQHHKELFEALLDKGFVLSDKFYEEIFTELYPTKNWRIERLQRDVDMVNTLDFLYTKLDRDTEIQKIDIEQELKELIKKICDENLTFTEYLKLLNDFNKKIISLCEFYENNIQKRFNPKKYLEYAEAKYNTTYEDLNGYLLLAIINGLSRFSSKEQLNAILDILPNFDINSYVINKDIGYGYYKYVEQTSDIIGVDDEGFPIYADEHFDAEGIFEDYGENIMFNGNLMQYAILTDDLPMAKLLHERGATPKFIHNNMDYTWNYVNSHTMLNYLESIIGPQKYRHLVDEEQDYYLSLLGQTPNSGEAQPKKLELKKDDSNN